MILVVGKPIYQLTCDAAPSHLFIKNDMINGVESLGKKYSFVCFCQVPPQIEWSTDKSCEEHEGEHMNLCCKEVIDC